MTVHSDALEELTPVRGIKLHAFKSFISDFISFYSQHMLIVIIIGTCSEGWVSYQSSCYLVSITSITWSKAEEQCKAHGGHLLVLNTAEELVSSLSHQLAVNVPIKKHT